MHHVLDEWSKALTQLAVYLPPPGVAGSENDPDLSVELKKAYTALNTCQDQLRQLARQWVVASAAQGQTAAHIQALIKEGQDIFPEGMRFGRMMDIATIILERIGAFIKIVVKDTYGPTGRRHKTSKTPDMSGASHSSGDRQYEDIRRTFAFDPNTGWQTIFCCNRLAVGRPEGGPGSALTWKEPDLADECQEVQEFPEFKGFRVQSREARAGIDDWVFVPDPHPRNLAQIRSHTSDALYVGENRAFLWYPDDPQFLKTNTIETVRLVGDLRTLVLTYNATARDDLRRDLERDLDSLKRGASPSQDEQERFEASRDDIAIFRQHAEIALNLLRACTISKYEDHGKLMSRMLLESRASNAQNALEHNFDLLDEFYSYITTVLEQRIERRAQIGQHRLQLVLFILALVSGLSAAPAIQPFLTQTLHNVVSADDLLTILRGIVIVLIVAIVISLAVLVWSFAQGGLSRIRRRIRRGWGA